MQMGVGWGEWVGGGWVRLGGVGVGGVGARPLVIHREPNDGHVAPLGFVTEQRL